MFGSFKLYVILGVAGSLVTAAGGYYFTTQRKIENLKDEVVEVTTLNQTLENNVEVLEKTQQKQETLAEQLRNLNIQLRNREMELDELKNILFTHDLTRLSLEKPGLIEKRVNDATKQVFEDMGNNSNSNPSD